MTKYFTKYHPECANGTGHADRMAYQVKSSSVVVVKDGKPFILATFKRGYASERSNTIYANLWIHDPRAGTWHLHGYKETYGTAATAIFSCCRAFFDDTNANGVMYSVWRILSDIARFFNFKNFEIVE